MISAIALDDEPMALEVIKSHCSRLHDIKLLKCFTQASRAKDYVNKHPVDLILLDIEMPDINGITFYQSIKKPLMVIFTTAYSEYAISGFEVAAMDYLLKPIKFVRFERAIAKAVEYSQFSKGSLEAKNPYIFVRSNYSLVKVLFEEIRYLEKVDDYIRIHRVGNKSIYTLTSMIGILQKLPNEIFMRVHRSYAVNINYVTAINAKEVRLGEDSLPIGKTYNIKLE